MPRLTNMSTNLQFLSEGNDPDWVFYFEGDQVTYDRIETWSSLAVNYKGYIIVPIAVLDGQNGFSGYLCLNKKGEVVRFAYSGRSYGTQVYHALGTNKFYAYNCSLSDKTTSGQAFVALLGPTGDTVYAQQELTGGIYPRHAVPNSVNVNYDVAAVSTWSSNYGDLLLPWAGTTDSSEIGLARITISNNTLSNSINMRGGDVFSSDTFFPIAAGQQSTSNWRAIYERNAGGNDGFSWAFGGESLYGRLDGAYYARNCAPIFTPFDAPLHISPYTGEVFTALDFGGAGVFQSLIGTRNSTSVRQFRLNGNNPANDNTTVVEYFTHYANKQYNENRTWAARKIFLSDGNAYIMITRLQANAFLTADRAIFIRVDPSNIIRKIYWDHDDNLYVLSREFRNNKPVLFLMKFKPDHLEALGQNGEHQYFNPFNGISNTIYLNNYYNSPMVTNNSTFFSTSFISNSTSTFGFDDGRGNTNTNEMSALGTATGVITNGSTIISKQSITGPTGP